MLVFYDAFGDREAAIQRENPHRTDLYRALLALPAIASIEVAVEWVPGNSRLTRSAEDDSGWFLNSAPDPLPGLRTLSCMLEVRGGGGVSGRCSGPLPPLTLTLAPFKCSERGEGKRLQHEIAFVLPVAC